MYEVYCRECGWQADEPVDLKGAANLLAGRHISQTGHVVALKTIDGDGATQEGTAGDFYRGRRSVSFEYLQAAADAPADAEVRRCGPIDCVVEPV
jgi:hypothetical protein